MIQLSSVEEEKSGINNTLLIHLKSLMKAEKQDISLHNETPTHFLLSLFPYHLISSSLLPPHSPSHSHRRVGTHVSGIDRATGEEEDDTICIAEELGQDPESGLGLGPGLLTGLEPMLGKGLGSRLGAELGSGSGSGLGLGPRLGPSSMMTADAKEEHDDDGSDFGGNGHGHGPGPAMMLRQLTLKGDDMELKGVQSEAREEMRLGLGAMHGVGGGSGLGPRSGSRIGLAKSTPGEGMDGSPIVSSPDYDFHNADTIVIQTSRSVGHIRTPGSGGVPGQYGYGSGVEPGSRPGSGLRTNRTNGSVGDNTPSTIIQERSPLSLGDDDDDDDDDDNIHHENDVEIEEEEYEDDFDDVDDQQHHSHLSTDHTIAVGHPLHNLSHSNQPSQTQQSTPNSNDKIMMGSFKPSLSLVDALAADRHRLETQHQQHYQENKYSARGPGSLAGSIRERLGNAGEVDENEHAIGAYTYPFL